MKKQKTDAPRLTQPETRLIEQLREHPQLMVRVQSILEIARHAEGPLQTADAVEALLIEEMRRWGNATLRPWASRAEERVSTELQRQDPAVRGRKRKR